MLRVSTDQVNVHPVKSIFLYIPKMDMRKDIYNNPDYPDETDDEEQFAHSFDRNGSIWETKSFESLNGTP